MPSDQLIGGARATLGQGLGMGWGDEAEAWLRSKLGGGSYEENLAKVRSEYAQYSKENPFLSGALEFAGGVAPGVAAMFVPGGQPVAAAQLGRAGAGALSRLAASPMARMTATGSVMGGVTGAGTAEEGQRTAGAGSGAVMGAGVGAALPLAMRGTGAGAGWLRERLFPSTSLIEQRAAEKMNRALAESGMKPADIATTMKKDVAMGVPSVVANTNPALADLAEAVAQRTGPGARRVEQRLTEQKLGARERAYQQTVKGLHPGDFYADEQRMVEELRKKAASLYDNAYAAGEVNDPRIMEVLKNPQFKGFYDRAREIADAEALAAKLRGEDPTKYALPNLYVADAAGNVTVQKIPDVRTLDYIKRGIDATIERGFKGEGMSTAEASALRDLRRQFVNAIDENVPAYKDARRLYAGDMEVLDALRQGIKDFGKLDHEQVISMVAGMGPAEKEAFRTGVARGLYGKIMDPSGNFNAAQRIIGSPEMQAKLQPLFDNPAEFNLFKSAMEREAQLFHQANRVLGGSQTGKRIQMREELEGGPGIGEAMASAVTGGWNGALTNLVVRAVRSGEMTEKTAARLADMLMSKDPAEVAAVVKLLEDHAARALPKAAQKSAAEYGTVGGTSAAMFPAPTPKTETNLEADIESAPAVKGPDIEADIAAEEAKRKK